MLLAVVVFAFLSVQVAIAGNAGDAGTASHGKRHAKSSKQQLRELRRALEAQAAVLQAQSSQLQALRNQLAALQGLSGAPAVPTGAAGGDLSGTYPNPTIGPNAIGGAEVTDGSLLPADFNPLNVDGAAGTPSLRTLGTGATQALPGNATPGGPPTGTAGGGLTNTYPNPTIAAGAVHGPDLTTRTLGFGTFDVPDSSFTQQSFSCPNAGEVLLSGGSILGTGSTLADVRVVEDEPFLDSGNIVWRVGVANNPGGTGTITTQVRLICLGA